MFQEPAKNIARKGWYEALIEALQQEDSPVMQLATIDTSTHGPHVRSLVHRAFLTTPTLPALPLILTTTDVRTAKVVHMNDERRVEVVYWIPRAQAQFRIAGRASVVPAPGHREAYPSPKGVVYEALDKEAAGEGEGKEKKRGGFDWEAKRIAVFDRMSGRMKATWCRPVPGTPLEACGADGWPETLPKLGEAEREEDERYLAMALSNFALLLVEPFEVDHVELGVQPDRRTRYERDWENERVVEFKATSVVP